MSEGYLFFEDALPAEEVKTQKVERALKRLAIALAAVLGLELVWFLGITPCLPFSRVDVQGMNALSRDLVFRTAGITEKSSYFGTDPRAAERALATLPLVESVQVTKRFPDGLSIRLKPRMAVAVALAMVDGRSTPVYFDRNGVVFSIGSITEDAVISSASMPVISGLSFELPSVGMRLPGAFASFLTDLERIERSSPELLAGISEIRIQQKAYEGYELIVYPAQRSVRVRMGSELNEDALRYMMLVLDVLASKGVDADEIDFRTGTVSYRTKEASSG